MGVDVTREGKTCEWCGNTQENNCTLADVGGIIGKILICDVCVTRDEKARGIKCHVCNGLVWELGGLRNHKGKHHCLKCYTKAKEKEKTKQKREKFLKDHWKTWIFILMGIIGLLIAKDLI